MKISVCIAAYRATTLPLVLSSLVRQTHKDWEVFVVEQGHDSRVIDVVSDYTRLHPAIHLLNISDRGTCRARNAGMLASSGDLIAFIDDDCEAAADWLTTMEQLSLLEPRAGIIGGQVSAPPKQRRELGICPAVYPAEAVYDPTTMRIFPKGLSWIGCNVAFTREALEKIGSFDSYLGPGTQFPAAEDNDMQIRAAKKGIVTRTSPLPVVVHAGGWRYGLGNMFRLRRNYAFAQGAVAAKGEMLGWGGRKWLESEWYRTITSFRQPHHAVERAFRAWYFQRGYRLCMNHYSVDTSTWLLKRVDPAG